VQWDYSYPCNKSMGSILIANHAHHIDYLHLSKYLSDRCCLKGPHKWKSGRGPGLGCREDAPTPPTDCLENISSWIHFLLLLQISLVKTVFLLLVTLWFYGMLPISIAIPLNHFVERRSLERLESPKERTCKVIFSLCYVYFYIQITYIQTFRRHMKRK
jgi:hypothetical protein